MPQYFEKLSHVKTEELPRERGSDTYESKKIWL